MGKKILVTIFPSLSLRRHTDRQKSYVTFQFAVAVLDGSKKNIIYTDENGLFIYLLD